MRLLRYIAPAVLTGLLAAGAVADSLVQLNYFCRVSLLSNQFVDTLRIDAPPAAMGQPAMIYADNMPIAPIVLIAGTNLVSVPQLHPHSYTVAGPKIQPKSIFEDTPIWLQ